MLVHKFNIIFEDLMLFDLYTEDGQHTTLIAGLQSSH